MTFALVAEAACASGGICTAAGTMLTEVPAARTLPGPAAPDEDDGDAAAALSASFPASRFASRLHKGAEDRPQVVVMFSEAVASFAKDTPSVAVTGATVASVQAHTEDGLENAWIFFLTPDGDGDATFALVAEAASASGGICTSAGTMLTQVPTALTVPGPAALSVADARAHENNDATLDFAVTLDRASTLTVTVGYATTNGTATAGADYTATSGTLTFTPGDIARTVSVPVLDDAINDGGETMTLTLSNASNARIVDGTATGTIANSDPLQQAWIARFGRTVASQVVDAIGDRFSGGGTKGVTVGGQGLDASGGAVDEAIARDRLLVELAEPRTAPLALGMTGRELLLASSFAVGGGGEQGAPSWGAWGRFATGGFEAEVEGTRLEGDVTTALLGADVSRDRWLAGVAVSASRGEGPFRLTGSMESNRERGTVESSLTGVHPYASVRITDRVALWGAGGYGAGEMTIAEDGGTPIETDIEMKMAAVGLRGDVLEASSGDALDLTLRSDALWVRTTSDDTAEMVAAEADMTRLRLVMDASRSFEAGAGATLTPRIEAGVRHDAGDAEEGTGLDLGAGLRYQGAGITIEGAVRTLLAHGDAAYEEWGASGAIRVDPGAAGRGVSLRIAPTFGNAASGAERLWSARDAGGLGRAGDFEAKSRLDAELGYGTRAPHGPGLVTPYAGLTLSGGPHRALRTGLRWNASPGATVSLEATRERPGSGDAATNALTLRAEARW